MANSRDTGPGRQEVPAEALVESLDATPRAEVVAERSTRTWRVVVGGQQLTDGQGKALEWISFSEALDACDAYNNDRRSDDAVYSWGRRTGYDGMSDELGRVTGFE